MAQSSIVGEDLYIHRCSAISVTTMLVEMKKTAMPPKRTFWRLLVLIAANDLMSDREVNIAIVILRLEALVARFGDHRLIES